MFLWCLWKWSLDWSRLFSTSLPKVCSRFYYFLDFELDNIRSTAWIGPVLKANDVHPVVECSNKGICDRSTGLCTCFANYEGISCEKNTCPSDCHDRGLCYTQASLATEAGRIYDTPWDANKQIGCVCDVGYRGLDCSMVECPSGPDPMKGYGNEAGRDCSGRGICDYSKGVCRCFQGFSGTHCQHLVRIFCKPIIIVDSPSIIHSRRIICKYSTKGLVDTRSPVRNMPSTSASQSNSWSSHLILHCLSKWMWCSFTSARSVNRSRREDGFSNLRFHE